MKVFSLILLVAGWFLVVSAIAMLRPAFVAVFVAAGVAVELLALVLFARAQVASSSASFSRQERHY